MFIGVYLLLSLIVFLLTLFLRSPAGANRFHKGCARPWLWYYTGLSLLLVTLCFAGFIALICLEQHPILRRVLFLQHTPRLH